MGVKRVLQRSGLTAWSHCTSPRTLCQFSDLGISVLRVWLSSQGFTDQYLACMVECSEPSISMPLPFFMHSVGGLGFWASGVKCALQRFGLTAPSPRDPREREWQRRIQHMIALQMGVFTGQKYTLLLSSEYVTHKTVKARLWPCLPGRVWDFGFGDWVYRGQANMAHTR